MRLFGLEFRGDILRRYIQCPPSCSHTAFATTLQLNKSIQQRRMNATPIGISNLWNVSLAPSSKLQKVLLSKPVVLSKCIQLLKTFARVVIDAFMSIKTRPVEKCSFASSDGADNGFISCMSRSYSSRWNRSFLPSMPVRQALQ